jgi:hypothetical protein
MSDIMKKVKSIVEEHLLVEEDKSHIINKMPLLHRNERDTLIRLFKVKPHLEKKIDWNKWRTLTFDDFYDVLSHVSKSERTRKVKKMGIKGLKEGKDYLTLDNTNFTTGADTLESGVLIGAYIPLTYEASKLIASDKIGSCEGRWCTASNDESYWHEYVYLDRGILVYFIYENTKYAAVYWPENNRIEQLYDADDKTSKYLPGINQWPMLPKINDKVFKQAIKIIKETRPANIKPSLAEGAENLEYEMMPKTKEVFNPTTEDVDEFYIKLVEYETDNGDYVEVVYNEINGKYWLNMEDKDLKKDIKVSDNPAEIVRLLEDWLEKYAGFQY